MKALDILKLMLAEPERIYPWPVSVLAQTLGAPASTIYRHLQALKARDLVSRRPGGYILGRGILHAGAAYKNAMEKFGVQNIEQL